MIERCRLDPTHGLPPAARAAFARDGVLVIEGFAAAAACDALRERALALVAEHASAAPGTVFSTRDQRHAKDAYFEASASRIGAFFEEGAFDAAGALQVPLDRAVNKLGHALHDLDPVGSNPHAELAGRLRVDDPVVDRSAAEPDAGLRRGLHDISPSHRPLLVRSGPVLGTADSDHRDRNRAVHTMDSRTRRGAIARRASGRRLSCSSPGQEDRCFAGA